MSIKTLSGASLLALALTTVSAHAQTTDGATPDVSVAAQADAVRDASADSEGTRSYTPRATTTLGKVALTPRETAASVSVLTRQEMNDLNLNTFTDALNWVPGVVFVSNDQSQGQFISRGAALESMSDGAAVIGGGSGYQQLDTYIFDRIEVLKGPAGLLQGNGAISGVVNTVKKRPTQELSANARVSYGSWNNLIAQADVSGPLDTEGKIRARVVASHTATDEFYQRAHENRNLVYGVIDMDLSSTTLVSASYTRQLWNGPGFSGNPAYLTGYEINLPRDTNVYPDWSKYSWDTSETHLELEQKLWGDWRAKVNFTQRVQEFIFNDAYPYDGVTPALTDTYVRRHAVYDYMRSTLDATVSGSVNVLGLKQSFVGGYTRAYFRSWGEKVQPTPNLTGVSILDPNAGVPDFTAAYNTGSLSSSFQTGVYAQARLKPWQPLTIVLGGRLTDYDSGSQTVAPSPVPGAWVENTVWHKQPTYYAGALLDLTKQITAYASYSDIFSPNTVTDYTGTVLPPVIGGQWEGGLKGAFFDKRLNASLAYFSTHQRNRSLADAAHPGYYLASGRIEVTGYEAEVSGRLLPHWQVVGGYTHLHAWYEVASASSQGYDVSAWYPHDQIKLWNKLDFAGTPLRDLTLGGGVVYQSRTWAGTTGTNLYRTQYPYAVTSIAIDYRLTPNVSLSANVENLFDVTYYTRLGGTNTYNTYGRPRNFTLSLKATY